MFIIYIYFRSVASSALSNPCKIQMQFHSPPYIGSCVQNTCAPCMSWKSITRTLTLGAFGCLLVMNTITSDISKARWWLQEKLWKYLARVTQTLKWLRVKFPAYRKTHAKKIYQPPTPLLKKGLFLLRFCFTKMQCIGIGARAIC